MLSPADACRAFAKFGTHSLKDSLTLKRSLWLGSEDEEGRLRFSTAHPGARGPN